MTPPALYSAIEIIQLSMQLKTDYWSLCILDIKEHDALVELCFAEQSISVLLTAAWLRRRWTRMEWNKPLLLRRPCPSIFQTKALLFPHVSLN